MFNGDDGARTHDFRLAKPALSQLSYVPDPINYKYRRSGEDGINDQFKMGPGRLELPTSRLSGVRSSQLSYEPNHIGLV